MSTKTKTTVTEEREMGASSSIEAADIKIAVMNSDIRHMNDTLARIETKFDSAMINFVTVDKLSDAQKSSQAEHVEIYKSITKLEQWNTWASRLIAGAIVSVIIYIVVTNYQHLVK